MNTESIIGIVASIITIIGAPYAFYKFINPLIKKWLHFPYADLLSQLMQKDLLNDERKKILMQLNKSSLIKNRITEDYIKNFTLGNRSKEAVLFDILDSNNIVPECRICKEFLGNNMPSFLEQYEAKRQIKKEEPAPAPVKPIMVEEPKVKPARPSGEQTVYMSEKLKERYPDTCSRLTQILEKHHVNYKFLKGTKDIWCRDYMPIQTENGKLIQFKYDPSYLRDNKEWEESRSDVKDVCELNGFKPEFSDINLDGGNVLICDRRAIITDRIISENPDYNEKKLKTDLARLLECEIIIIPAYKSKDDDLTGHADGMVRFVDRNTILGNKLDNEYQYIKNGMQKAVEQYGFNYISMPFFIDKKDPKHPYSAIGVYVNYLEVDNLIVMPIFGREEDKQAKDIIQKAFPNKVIETIDYNDVALEGGLLNCTTWVFRQ